MSTKSTKTSRILDAVHETARDLEAAGFVSKRRMKDYGTLCLVPVPEYRPTSPSLAPRRRDTLPAMAGRVEWVLAALEQADVRYLVVGGVAVVLHGYLRTTLDLDLVLQLDRENLQRALNAFSDLGFQPQAPVPLGAFADPLIREAWVREKNMTVFSLWHPEQPGFAVDLFVEEPFDFEDVYRRAIRVPLPGTEAAVVSRSDLIAMKRAAGRPRDLEDISALSDLAAGEG